MEVILGLKISIINVIVRTIINKKKPFERVALPFKINLIFSQETNLILQIK